MDKRPIGVFDTGVGGLTVVKEVLKRLPNEQIIYIGDAARAPYGSKPFRVINEYALEITHFLVSKDVKVIVSACNTISSTSHKLLSKSSKTPVLDIIKPVIDEFAEIYAKVGIMATEATVKMGAHEKLLLKKNPNIEIYSVSCPQLVSFVEMRELYGREVELILRRYLTPMLEVGIDYLILGCTHYPFLMDCIKKIIGTDIKIINPAYSIADRLEKYLTDKDLTANSGTKNEFYTTGDIETFEFFLKTTDISNYILGKVVL